MAELNKVEGQELEPTPASTNEAGASTEPKGGNEPPAGDEESKLFEGIPDDHPIRKYVPKLRNENASKRQSLHERDALNAELKTKLEASKTTEEVSQLIAEYDEKLAEKDLQIVRKDIAREFGLPAKVETALAGKDLESLRTEAKEWQELFGNRKPAPLTPTGGRTPAEPAEDVKSLAKSIRSRRQ